MKLTSFSNFVNCFILYCFLMIAVFFISCEQRPKEQLFYDEDGRLSVKVIGEDMANACYWVYYNNGETKGKYCLIDSIRQGIEYGYYENGNLKSKIYLVDDKTNGEGFFYHENGKMKKYISNITNDKINGKVEYFNEEGIIYKLNYYYDDEVYYTKTYIIEKGLIKDSITTYSAILSVEKDTFYIGDVVKVRAFIPNIHDSRDIDKFVFNYGFYSSERINDGLKLKPARHNYITAEGLTFQVTDTIPGAYIVGGYLLYEHDEGDNNELHDESQKTIYYIKL